MMRAWILYEKEAAVHNRDYIQMYMIEGKRRNMDIRLIYKEDLIIGNGRRGLIFQLGKEEVDLPDFVINRTRDAMLARQFEGVGIPVFNHSEVTEICNNKARTSQQLASLGIDCVPGRYYKNDRLCFMDWEDTDIVKAVDGHGGGQVFSGAEEREAIIKGIGMSDFIIQPKINGPGQDVRVYLVGNEMIAAVRRQAVEGFRANFSLGGEASLIPLGEKEVRTIQTICKHFSFAMVGIDFIIDEGGNWLFNEIEDAVGARMLYQCSDIHIVKKYLIYIERFLNERRKNNEIRY